MSDIDYVTNTSNGFTISLGDNPSKATGNKLLANRFEITFLTNTRQYLWGSNVVNDNYGGDSQKYIGQPQSLNNPQSIAASITITMNRTIDSIKNNQANLTNLEEKLSSAELVGVEIRGEVVYATIRLIPMKYSSSNELYYSIPIRGV